jgi:transglutaminase-like putative cysteine protease
VNENTKKKGLFFFRKEGSDKPEDKPQESGTGWGGWQSWVKVVLVFLTLEVAVLSVEQAHWVDPQPSLTLILFISVLVGVILARVRMFGLFKFIIIGVVGLLVAAWQVMNVLTVPETASRFSHFMDVVASWFGGSAAVLPGDEKVIFVVFITLLTWIIGSLSIYFVLRRNNAWLAAVMGGLVILFNLSNLPDFYYIYFFLYFFAAALLVAVTRMTGRSLKAGNTANYSRQSLVYLGISLLCIIGVAASFAWVTPQVKATGLQDFIATRLPWQRDLLESRYNIFNVVPSKQSVSTASSLKDIDFGERWNQGDEIEYIVYSAHPSYWRVGVYSTYTSEGWTSSPAEKVLLEANTPWKDAEGTAGGEVMKYAVTTEIFTDVLLDNGGFLSSDVPVRVNIGEGGDIETVNAARILNPGEGYTVTAQVVTAGSGELSAAGDNYPEAIKSVYLQLPPDLPPEIGLLSENLTRNAATTYAKVTAIVGYLADFPYNLEIEAPPEDADSVAYFLFNRQEGFCLHFASAVAVMLRSIDIPSRLVVGYLPGEPGDVAGQYIIRDKYYHAWPQVYFPGYGWVDIEATPGSSGNQIAIDTPLISSSTIEQSQNWGAYWPLGVPTNIQSVDSINVGRPPDGATAIRSGSFSFAPKLGQALLIVFGAAAVIALIIGIVMLARSLSFRWLWYVDREKLMHKTYINVCRLAAMVGLVPAPQQTPLEFAVSLSKVFPEQAAALDVITQSYMDSRYGGKGGKPGLAEEAEILKARRLVYDTLIQRLSPLRRLFSRR